VRRFFWNNRSGNSTSIDDVVASFAKNWGQPGYSLKSYWEGLKGDRTLFVLAALIKIDLQRRFQGGERPSAGDYFAIFPEIAEDDDRALSLVYEEFCLLEENDDRPDVSDFCARYEPWRDSLISQLGYHRHFSQIVGAEKPKLSYPSVGERFATYELRSILGKGGAAQVYLATDDLGGRQVVLKVSSSIGLEPSILASLEHRNIVPIYNLVDSPGSELRGICMPYRPGMTLEKLLKIYSLTGLPTKASTILEILEVKGLDPKTTDDGWRDFPLKGTYTEAVAWLGLSVANALAYLHDRHIYHRDIKPANILLTHRQGPLLFDFNLAHSPNAPEHAQTALLGGTLPYMAPEQLRAFLDPSIWDKVGASADIYAFGLVMREMVTGLQPDLPNSNLPLTRSIQDLHDRRHELVASIREINPDVPPSLEAIILKCLAFKPVDRYDNAKALADDLKRFLERRPLVWARNPSPFELVLNWLYRRGKIAAGLGLMIGICALIVGTRQPQSGPSNPVRMGTEDPYFTDSAHPKVDALEVSAPSRFNALTNLRFQQVVTLLDSDQIEGRVEAERIFEQFRKKYPNSAWPILYLALTQKKLGNRDVVSLTNLIREISMKSDAEEAILQRLKEDSSSVELRVMLGFFYSDKGQFDKARQTLEEAIQRNPEHEGALALLGNVERVQERYVRAIEFYQRAIEMARKKDNPALVSELREILIPVMLIEVDLLLSPTPDDSQLKKAGDLLGRIDSQLPLMELELKNGPGKGPSLKASCNIAICRGALNSGRGYVLAAQGNKDEALSAFRSSLNYFDEALGSHAADVARIQTEKEKAATDLRPYIQEKKDVLDRRVKNHGMSLDSP